MSFESPPPSGRGRRSRVAVAGTLIGVVALGAAGVFAVGQLRSGTQGGADDPEAVGSAFMSALEQEDVLGMVDLLLPGEREVFRGPLIEMVSELTRLEVLSDAASLGDLSGLDIELTDETTAVEPTNVADISNIVMSATISASLDGDQLPLGDLILDRAGDQFNPADLDQPTTTEPFTVSMTVVEQDGRWYLSLFHTVAEAARGELGRPIPAVGLTPRGGATPEGAIDALLDGVEQLDLGRVIAAINPNEAAALQRYAPLFIDDADAFVDGVPLDWQVTRREYAVTGSGAKRSVAITALRIDGTADGNEFSLELVSGCAVVTVDGESVDTCTVAEAGTDAAETLDDFLGGSPAIGDLTTAFEDVWADYDPPGITVQQVGGEWFVSPLGSGFDQILAVLRALDRAEIDRLIDATTSFVTDLEGEFDEFPFPAGDPLSDDLFGDDLFDDDPLGDDFEADDFEAEQQALETCNELDAVDDVIACLQTAVGDGVLPDYYIGVELRFPECGLAEVSLGRTPLFELSDEEYTALIEQSAACFGELIASGEVEQFEVQPDYLRPECAEGRNPWSLDLDGDDDLFSRWLDCIYG